MSEMLWEANSDVQMSMSWKEFQEMYLRCINDKTGLEPKKFFHMVEFLMHDASDKVRHPSLPLDSRQWGSQAASLALNAVQSLTLLSLVDSRHSISLHTHG